MFAPPPLQFSQAEIARLKLEALARLQEKRQSAESAGSGGKDSKVKSPSEACSPKTSRKVGLFARSNKLKVSKPIAQDVQKSVVEGAEPEKDGANRVKKDAQDSVLSPIPFGEQPRKAPPPPKRPTRPPTESQVPPVRGASPVGAPRYSPPPIPEKSPRRQTSVSRQTQPIQAERKRSVLATATLNKALADLSISDDASADHDRPAVPVQSSTDSGEADQTPSDGAMKQSLKKARRTSLNAGDLKPSSANRNSKRLSGVQSGKVDKAPKKRASAAATLEATLLELNSPGLKQPRRATEPSVKPDRTSPSLKDEQTLWKRRRKGETMSMLLDAGFFPGGEATLQNKKNPNISIHVKLPPPLSVLDKDLPDTPDSIMATPTELYQSVPRTALPSMPRSREPRRAKRSPLAQIAVTNVKANSGDRSMEVSPGRLSSIPEIASISEKSPPPSSGATTPVPTLIHLRGGSVVTVTPPELTAWQRHVYIQGPIKLPTPAIMPRKNSVASLEPFQEAIDQVYQHALAVPRRRSDDAVVEDICEWIDNFGFEDISYRGDTLMVDEITVDEVEEKDEAGSHEIERFSTPPLEPIASPLEKAVAKEVVEMSKPDPVPRPPIPPVENEETLRARGIARLSQHSTLSASSRKESLTLSKQESMAAFTPVPEHSMLATPNEPSEPDRDDGMRAPLVDQGGFDWDDDVEEMDKQPTWVAPAIARKKHELRSTRETRNPVVKMRRLRATALAIL